MIFYAKFYVVRLKNMPQFVYSKSRVLARILTLVVNAVCVSYVRYANCKYGFYRHNRLQKVNAVSIHTAGRVIISTHYVHAHGQAVAY